MLNHEKINSTLSSDNDGEINDMDQNLEMEADYYALKKWELGFLRQECVNLGLETFYNKYMARVQRSYLSIFVVLQTFISVTHVVVIVTGEQHPTAAIHPDLICYTFGSLIVWISLFAAFKERLIKAYPWVPYVTSCAAVFTLIITDLTIPLYHAVITFMNPPLRPSYASHIIFAIYIFLPLSENLHVIILGAATTICYLIIMTLISYRLESDIILKVATEFIYFLCLNLFGLHFRLINEAAIRRTFLDRRELVEGNLLLKFARNQEKELLLSILPEHTAELMEKDIRAMIEKMRHDHRNTINTQNFFRTGTQWRSINKLYVQKHTNVTILYADVVNYTQITTQLPVRTLVDVLHELFVKFDEAAKEFHVLRIKFLGDCYYCVSGVPIKNKYHAKSCVDLGLRMIKDIRDVRMSRDLNIDMRIGIHSGSIISGVIGACKWQYDIWSRDVIIANRLESTGEAGKVHVTMQTLELLDNEYIYEDGTEKAKTDPTLIKHNIQTYLIVPQFYENNNDFLTPCSNSRLSVGVKRKTIQNKKERNLITRNFMQNSMEQFREIMKQTNVEMAQELDRMPIGKFQFNKIFSTSHQTTNDVSNDLRLDNISTFFMLFETKHWEWSFMKQPDLMLKYSVLMSFAVFICIFSIQVFNNASGFYFWLMMSLSGIILFILVPVTWFKKLWDVYTPYSSDDLLRVRIPRSKFFRMLYDFSNNIMENFFIRAIIYFVTILILLLCSLIYLVECNYELNNQLSQESFSGKKFCTNSWSVTQCLTLTIGMAFLFLRIHFILKAICGLGILSFYSWVVFDELYYIYNNSASMNPGMNPKVAHLMLVIFTVIIFHWIDRQSEYIARVDYNWKRQLLNQKEEAEVTKQTNKILVENILPTHVAEIYINRQLKNEFYNEEYENVAVMFATIKNMEINTDIPVENEKSVLKILNEIICDFDEKLQYFDGYFKVEKIKVAGWTYMAACGLDPARCDSSSSLGTYRSMSGITRTSLMTNGRRSLNPTTSDAMNLQSNHNNSNTRQSNNVTIVMAEFALELMKVLRDFSNENFKQTNPGLLRVGISNGKVMAGVVGSSKPLYDIWGNAVNMASRMDSTGVPGRIQITEESAQVLQSYGYQCEYRGRIFVKGRGKIPTYFASINENYEFIKTEILKNLSTKL
ncbi:adenylyl cyclase X E [Toxorhynchites rutilus septentrionalis]|uniref:adenylyl cyclase X E n=1 Tax=Toxorhynchites rutilus septentrionalis TaxID=329112 RepID=UPI00247A5BDE|nr:adenylyl cyclase X E [Toxorhynchites rutilus septentrionalis]XP_055628454.1 adenylyl cyclase X E [Toxorhynchites rutilus septentrionalis]